MGERPMLTEEGYARAEARLGVHHPVLDVFEANLPTIMQFEQQCSMITSGDEECEFIARNYGFLADAFVAAGPYTLEPEDLIAIWSRAKEIFSQSRYIKYPLVRMISSAYAIQGLENPEWKKYPRHQLETDNLPDGVLNDKVGLSHVRDRLDKIDASLEELDRYVYGKTDVGMAYFVELATKMKNGDLEAAKQWKEAKALEQTRKTPLLDSIKENFAGGLTGLYFPIDNALSKE